MRRVPVSGSAIEDLLGVDIHLPEKRRRDRVTIALVSQNGHALLDAERLEDCLRDAVGQTVERPDDDEAVVTLVAASNPLPTVGITSPQSAGETCSEAFSNSAETSFGPATSNPVLRKRPR